MLDEKYAQHGIEHTFTLINTSSRAVSITELKPNCICIDKSFPTDEQHTQDVIGMSDYGLFPDKLSLPMKVAPGAQVKIFVSVDTSSVFTGDVDESVDVMIEGEAKPAATLEMVGVLQNGISFSSSVLDFHQVHAGEASSLLLSITFDRRLHRFLPDRVKLKVISNDPNISVTQEALGQAGQPSTGVLPNEIIIPMPQNVLTDFPEDQKAVYKVTLSPNAEIGSLKGELSVIAPEYPSILLLVNARVPLSGDVVGEISASPPLIVFGDVPVGTSPMKSITITDQIPDRRGHQSLKILCPNPNLLARLVPVPSDDPASKHLSTYKLEVTISPQAPVGALEDRVNVLTPSGQHLVVRIFASLSSRQKHIT